MNKIYGIVGHPVAQSLSPALFAAAFKASRIDAEYRRFELDPSDPEALAHFCYETDVNGIAGFSVTMPYKEAVMAYMDHYDPLAKAVGSVNTVVNEKSKLIGYNTDVLGAMQALTEKTTLPGKKALVLGAGGAARAIVYGLKQYGADVYVWNRTAERAGELAAEFDVGTVAPEGIARTGFDVVVNATPAGPLRAEHFKAGAVVMDIVTHPEWTPLLHEAKKAGAITIPGSRMLLLQAAEQFKIWFKKEAPLEAMEAALNL